MVWAETAAFKKNNVFMSADMVALVKRIYSIDGIGDVVPI